MGTAVPGLGEEPETYSGSVTDLSVCTIIYHLPRCMLAGSWVRSWVTETGPSTPVWELGVPSNNLTTMPTSHLMPCLFASLCLSWMPLQAGPQTALVSALSGSHPALGLLPWFLARSLIFFVKKQKATREGKLQEAQKEEKARGLKVGKSWKQRKLSMICWVLSTYRLFKCTFPFFGYVTNMCLKF